MTAARWVPRSTVSLFFRNELKINGAALGTFGQQKEASVFRIQIQVNLIFIV